MHDELAEQLRAMAREQHTANMRCLEELIQRATWLDVSLQQFLAAVDARSQVRH